MAASPSPASLQSGQSGACGGGATWTGQDRTGEGGQNRTGLERTGQNRTGRTADSGEGERQTGLRKRWMLLLLFFKVTLLSLTSIRNPGSIFRGEKPPHFN